MKRYRIFVSGVQKELKEERFAVKELILENSLLKKHFDVFLFEDLPAESKSADKTYLNEINKSDIYLGILGYEYGTKGVDGLSATEQEFREAIKKEKEILIFLKGKDDSKREKELREIIYEIKKPDSGYVYKRFENTVELKNAIFNSLVVLLEDEGVISSFPFDYRLCQGGLPIKI